MASPTDSLPYPDPPFHGNINNTAAESQGDWPEAVKPPEGAPNVIVIMTDDVGFGAASTTGGPIHTGTMTELSKQGMLFNRFHTTALCSPTRASLLTGRLPHNASTGMIESQASGFPGYNAIISKSCATVADYLRLNGYNTAWFGKNHNTPEYETSSVGPFDRWPTGMGFEHFYGFLGGDTDQYHPNLWRDTVPIQPDLGKSDYHLDSDLADQTIDYIKKQNALSPDRPFFVYYAPGATHAPHQVPEEFIKPYLGAFSHGWDEQRKRTWEKQRELGVIPDNTELTPRPDNLPAWEDMRPDEKRVYARMMEVYAGFLNFTDHNIGRVINCIDELGKKDNTLVIYIQGDNGGSAEGTLRGSTNELTTLGNGLPESWEKILESVGGLGTEMYYNHFPVQWSWAMNSPMQWTKRYASHFGGTRNGMVMRWPAKIPAKTRSSHFHHVCDIMPTILEACNIPFPANKINGYDQRELDGISMVYCWDTENSEGRRKTQIFEMAGNRGMYENGWMLCTTPLVFNWVTSPKELKPEDFSWELYNLDDDFSQGKNYLIGDVTAEHLLLAKELERRWWTLAGENNILPIAFTASETMKGQEGRPELLGNRAYCEFPDGITRLPEKCAPDLKNKSFNITATVSVSPSGTEGIIMTLGGRHGGFGLVMFDNKPTWIYKATNDKKYWYRIDWPDALKSDIQYDISVTFKYEGGEELGGPGVFSMTVTPHAMQGEQSPDTGMPKTLTADAILTVPAEFSNSDTLNVGSGTGTPLMEEFAQKMPFTFTGELVKVAITADNENMTPEMKKRIGAAQRAFNIATD